MIDSFRKRSPLFIMALLFSIFFIWIEFFPETCIIDEIKISKIYNIRYNNENIYAVNLTFTPETSLKLKSSGADLELIFYHCGSQKYITDAYTIFTHDDNPTRTDRDTIIFWVNEPLPENGNMDSLIRDVSCFQISGRRFLDQRDYIRSNMIKFHTNHLDSK